MSNFGFLNAHQTIGKMSRILFFAALCFTLISNSYAQDKKVAVVTFYAVKKINMAGSKGGDESVARLANDTSFNLAPVLRLFHDQFFADYARNFSFDVLPEKQVLTNRDYKDFLADRGPVTDILNSHTEQPAKGYQVILPLKKHDNEISLVKMFDGCDGVMKVYLDFDMDKRAFGNAALVKVIANANIALFNKNGDMVFSLKRSAMSKISGAQVAGIPFMVPRKVLPLCESATTELLAALDKEMPALVKNAGTKL